MDAPFLTQIYRIYSRWGQWAGLSTVQYNIHVHILYTVILQIFLWRDPTWTAWARMTLSWCQRWRSTTWTLPLPSHMYSRFDSWLILKEHYTRTLPLPSHIYSRFDSLTILKKHYLDPPSTLPYVFKVWFFDHIKGALPQPSLHPPICIQGLILWPY
jgi:hypothetical protein